MKSLNILSTLAFIGAMVYFFKNPMERWYQNKTAVGAILYLPNQDDPTFSLCHPKLVYEYYQIHLKYEGGLRKIEEQVSPFYKDFPQQAGLNGYVTVRFVVNCKGVSGRYRLSSVNEDYRDFAFPKNINKQLLKACQSLNDWIPGRFRDQARDGYTFVTFKIKDGLVVEVLP